MNSFSLTLSGRLHSAKQQTRHNADVVRDHAPEYLRVEVRPRLPFATKHSEPSFEIRYDGLDPAPPFLEPRLHALAADQIPERSDDLVEYDIDDSFVPRQLPVRKRRIAAVRGHIARHNAVVFLDPVNHATVRLRVAGVAVQDLAVDDEHAFPRRQIHLVPERRFAPALYDDIGMVLEDGKQLVCVRHLLAQDLVPMRRAVHLLRLRQKGLDLPQERLPKLADLTASCQGDNSRFGLIDAGPKKLQLLPKQLFSLLSRLRVVDLAKVFLGLLLIPSCRDRSSGLAAQFHQQPVKRLDTVPRQGIVRRIMDVRLDCRGVGSHLAEILNPLLLGDLVDRDHHLLQRLRLDHRNVFLPYREGNRFSAVKLDKQRADAGIILRVLQLPVGQALHLLVNRTAKYLLDCRSILSAKTFSGYAAEVLLDQIIYFRVHRQDRIKYRKFHVEHPEWILECKRQFVKKLHRFPLADFVRSLYISPAESAS